MEPTFDFTSELWEYPSGETRWVFITVPPDDSDEIREVAPVLRGFGSVRVAATIGTTEWTTSVFPHKESGTYMLPVKRAVRDAEGVGVGDAAAVTLRVLPG